MEASRRGVSEVVASLLTLLIVVAVGTGLYLYLYYQYTLQQAELAREHVESEIASKQVVTVLLVQGNSTSGNVTVIFSTGPWPVRLRAVYVNDTLALDLWGSGLGEYPAYNVTELTFPSPIPLSPGDSLVVRVVYDGGVVEARGEVV